MERAVELALIDEVLAAHAASGTAMADEVLRVPAAHYLDPDHARAEREDWFLGQPHLAAFSSELAEPGDFASYDAGGVPIVVVRRPDGSVAAFENVCRHRAAPLVEGRGHATRVFACPFHGWSYDTRDGRLLSQPHACEGFATLDAADLGLRPLAVDERSGLIAVDRRRESAGVDVAKWLGGLASEIGSNGYDGFVPFAERVDPFAGNWKLLLETFFESYHVFSLHRESLAPQYLGIAASAHGFGPHNRFVVPMKSILDQAGVAEGERDLFANAVVQYFLAPDRILSHYHGVLAVTRFVPLSPGETLVTQALFTRGAVESASARSRLDEQFAFANGITADEDYPEAARVHRSLASGRVDHTLFGRNEAGCILFHDALARARAARRASDDAPRPAVATRGARGA